MNYKMRVIVVTFYDKGNEHFYTAVKHYSGDIDIIKEWLEYHIKSYDIQAYLSYKYKGENYEDEGFYSGCPCIELLEEMHKQDFYLCNFENFDYMIGDYWV